MNFSGATGYENAPTVHPLSRVGERGEDYRPPVVTVLRGRTIVAAGSC